MKRFVPITSDLSLIREKHRVLVQYLRLRPGNSLSCSAALSKQDLVRAREAARQPLTDGKEQVFETELAQLTWTRNEAGISLRFLDRGRTLADLELRGQEERRWIEGLTELTPGT